MRRVDCYIGAVSDKPHAKIYCDSKESSLLIKKGHVAGNDGRNECKVFKLRKVDKKLLRCKVLLYKKDILIAEVYVENLYECFSIRVDWLTKIGRRIRFEYVDNFQTKDTTYKHKCIQDYTMI